MSLSRAFSSSASRRRSRTWECRCTALQFWAASEHQAFVFRMLLYNLRIWFACMCRCCSCVLGVVISAEASWYKVCRSGHNTATINNASQTASWYAGTVCKPSMTCLTERHAAFLCLCGSFISVVKSGNGDDEQNFITKKATSNIVVPFQQRLVLKAEFPFIWPHCVSHMLSRKKLDNRVCISLFQDLFHTHSSDSSRFRACPRCSPGSSFPPGKSTEGSS